MRQDTTDDAFAGWLAAAERRYLADLTRAEVGRALRALGSCYLHRRGQLPQGRALDGRGKRAAFALYYGPLHFLVVRAIAEGLGEPDAAATTRPGHRPPRPIVDVGCGTGAAGAAWALQTGAEVHGFDVNAWAVGEAAWTYRTLGVRGTAWRDRVASWQLPRQPSLVLAAFVVNELPAADRDGLLTRLVEAARLGHRVVVIEPIARTVTPWWRRWEQALAPSGGASRQWRVRTDLPALLRDLDRAAGRRHEELTARTLST